MEKPVDSSRLHWGLTFLITPHLLKTVIKICGLCVYVCLKRPNGNEKSFPLHAYEEPALWWVTRVEEAAIWRVSYILSHCLVVSGWARNTCPQTATPFSHSALLTLSLWSTFPGKCFQNTVWLALWNNNPCRWPAALSAPFAESHMQIFSWKSGIFYPLLIGFNKGLVLKSQTEQREGCYWMLSVYLQKLSAEWIKFLFRADKGRNGLEYWCEGEPNIITFWLWAWLSLNYVFFLKSQGTWITNKTWGHWLSLFYLCGHATTIGDQEVIKRKEFLWNSIILLAMKKWLRS